MNFTKDSLFLSEFHSLIRMFCGTSAAHLSFKPVHKEGAENAEYTEDNQYPADWRREEDCRISAGKQQGAAQTFFSQWSQNECQNDCGIIQFKLADKITEYTENHHNHYINIDFADGKRTDDTEDDDTGNQNCI